MTTVDQVLALAASQVGITESPANSNRTPFGRDFGLDGLPWCAIWVWDLFHQFGADNALPTKTAGVYALMAAFQRTGRWYHDPQPGDIPIYDYGQGHTGIVASVQFSTITAYEGNTSPSSAGSQFNGGAVAKKTRPRDRHILGYGRPNYGSAPVTKKDENTMHDFARTIRWQDGSTIEVTEDGAMEGAGCTVWGSFYDLKPGEKLNLSNPPAPYALTPARTVPVVYKTPDGKDVVVDLPDKNGGVIAWCIGKDGKVVKMKFDDDFAAGRK